ncbi:MAG: IPT/TIG domain-containing protein, partial [Myxococcota bacterium]|nr:IPT/TIG domain-containing protein [Myxococcota bacterium]
MAPGKGPSAGGAFVNVTGSGFALRSAMLSYMYVRFNVTQVPMVWVSESEVHCVAPEHATGLVHVELTLNDQQYTSDMVAFEYQDVVAHSIEPRNGPVLGGTLVVVRGANFHAPGSRGLFCKFVGADVVAASWEGEEAVRCATPSVSSAGFVAVHLISNDAVYVTSVAFQYQEAVSVLSVEPRTGLLAGGTLLRVLGSGFVPSMTALVRVGSQPVVVARVLSSVLLECTTPLRTEAGLLSVEVTLNDQDYSSDEVLFEYQDAARVLEVSPSKGPSGGGGFVNVSGTGFSQRSFLLSYLFARFNETRVPVVWVSSSEVHCVAPEHATGVVHVELTLNDQQYTADAVAFEYQDVVAHS